LTLKEKLSEDFKEAMKARDEIRKTTVNLIRAAVKQIEVDTRTELDENEVLGVIAKQVKMRKDALPDFEKAGRTDLLETYNKEIDILMAYLPEQMTIEEIQKIAREVMAELGIEGGKQNMGKLMGALMPRVKGKADGGDVRKAIEGLL
jgi:uncharacterized protein YqeY